MFDIIVQSYRYRHQMLRRKSAFILCCSSAEADLDRSGCDNDTAPYTRVSSRVELRAVQSGAVLPMTDSSPTEGGGSVCLFTEFRVSIPVYRGLLQWSRAGLRWSAVSLCRLIIPMVRLRSPSRRSTTMSKRAGPLAAISRQMRASPGRVGTPPRRPSRQCQRRQGCRLHFLLMAA
jgi:hypothetical protein